MRNKREIGAVYEKEAGAYLESRGYEILHYNFRCRTGEIDIVAKDGAYLVFVEVKYRDNIQKGYPLEAISLQKQKKISKAALYYLSRYGMSDMPIRFDVVGILEGEIQLIQNAFDYIS